MDQQSCCCRQIWDHLPTKIWTIFRETGVATLLYYYKIKILVSSRMFLGHVIHLNSSVSEILLMFLYPCVQVFVTPMTIRTKERKRKWPSAGNIKSNIAYNWCTSAKLRSGTILVTLFWLIFSPSHWGFVSPVLLRNICSRPKSNEAGEEAMLKKSRKMRIYRLLVCRNALETNSSREALLRWILSCPNPNRKRPLRWKIP